MRDVVAFMRWDRLVPWKVLSLKEYPNKPIMPIGFGSNKDDFYDFLEPGSQIWVVTRIAHSHSLAARMSVQKIVNRETTPQNRYPPQAVELLKQWKYVAVADLEDSEFFETNNAASVLKRKNIHFTQSRPNVYCEESLENVFQECMKQGRRTVFISYRWVDAKKFAKGLARELRKAGYSPWLDALALPEYQAQREANEDAPRLSRLIKSGIERSKYAIVINTKTYGESIWTTMERDHILENSIPTFHYHPKETQELNGKQRFYVKVPREVLQAFRKWVLDNPVGKAKKP